MEHLPHNIRIDWLRFQVSSHVDMVRTITKLLGLPWEKYCHAHLHDIRETNVLALNKVWHRVYEFQNSLIGVREPDSGPCTDRIYHHFVDLNGATLAAVDFNKLIALLAICQNEVEFVGNRIDIALDFPLLILRVCLNDAGSILSMLICFLGIGLCVAYLTLIIKV